MTPDANPIRRGLLLSAAASALGARPSIAAEPGPHDRTLSAAAFGAVGDGHTDDTEALQNALDATVRQQGVLVIPPGTYRVTRTLRYVMVRGATGDIGRRNGIQARGARLLSAITTGGNVIEFLCRATVRFTLIDGLEVLGNGKEGHGIYVECDRKEEFFYNFCIRDAIVQACGGDGCRMIGNVFEGQIIDSYFRSNGGAGASFAHGEKGGILSSIHVFGCIFGDNHGVGAALRNKCYDVAFHGCYFLLNAGAGFVAENGCTLLSNCGFENNFYRTANFASGGPGIELKSFGTLVGCTAYSIYQQTGLIKAYVTAPLVLVGCSGSGDGEASGAGLAELAGSHKGSAVLVGCAGRVDHADGFEPLEIGGPDGGIRFGASWQNRNLLQLGDFRLWVDRQGRLRLKQGAPHSDEDGQPVGPQPG